MGSTPIGGSGEVIASGAMAQLVARLVRNEKARGSNPLSSTIGSMFEPVAGEMPSFSFERVGWISTDD